MRELARPLLLDVEPLDLALDARLHRRSVPSARVSARGGGSGVRATAALAPKGVREPQGQRLGEQELPGLVSEPPSRVDLWPPKHLIITPSDLGRPFGQDRDPPALIGKATLSALHHIGRDVAALPCSTRNLRMSIEPMPPDTMLKHALGEGLLDTTREPELAKRAARSASLQLHKGGQVHSTGARQPTAPMMIGTMPMANTRGDVAGFALDLVRAELALKEDLVAEDKRRGPPPPVGDGLGTKRPASRRRWWQHSLASSLEVTIQGAIASTRRGSSAAAQRTCGPGRATPEDRAVIRRTGRRSSGAATQCARRPRCAASKQTRRARRRPATTIGSQANDRRLGVRDVLFGDLATDNRLVVALLEPNADGSTFSRRVEDPKPLIIRSSDKDWLIQCVGEGRQLHAAAPCTGLCKSRKVLTKALGSNARALSIRTVAFPEALKALLVAANMCHGQGPWRISWICPDRQEHLQRPERGSCRQLYCPASACQEGHRAEPRR